MAKLTKKDWEYIEEITKFTLVWTKSHIIFEKKVDENYSLLIRLRYVYGRLIFDFYGNSNLLDSSKSLYEGGRIFDLPLDTFENEEQKQFFKENSDFDEAETFDKDKVFQFIQIKVNFLEKNFGTLQKCLETYDSNKYPDYAFNRKVGWMKFGFLNAIYGKKERAIELLEKFGNTDFSYEYMGEKRHSKCDVIRQKYTKLALKNIEDKEKILELIKEMNLELDEVN